jgi:hypothetical protein
LHCPLRRGSEQCAWANADRVIDFDYNLDFFLDLQTSTCYILPLILFGPEGSASEARAQSGASGMSWAV